MTAIRMVRTRITIGQLKSMAEWTGLEVRVPAGMMLSQELTISSGQLAELTGAVAKHQKVTAYEREISDLKNTVCGLEEQALTNLSLHNEVLGWSDASSKLWQARFEKLTELHEVAEQRAMPHMDAITAKIVWGALEISRIRHRFVAFVKGRPAPEVITALEIAQRITLQPKPTETKA